MPISEKQLEANRRNAQHSTGPKTAEGKARSSRNNLRHGLTGQVTVLPGEDREAHDAFCSRLIAGFNPATPIEDQLAHSIAEDAWRLNRVAAIENNIFALGRGRDLGEMRNALADAQCFLDHARELNLLSLYEQRIHRNMQRNLNQFRELQRERKAAPAQVRCAGEINQAAQAQVRCAAEINQAAQAQVRCAAEINQAAQAQVRCAAEFNRDGFEFANAEINAAIDRDNRLNESCRASAIAEIRTETRAAA